MILKTKRVLELIDLIYNSFGGSEIVYTQGSCYQFHKILKWSFPEALPYYDGNHVITKIDDLYYDISGIVPIEGHILMTKSEMKDAESWIFNVQYPKYYHCFDLNEQEMTSFINYESEKELVQSLYRMYGYKKGIYLGMELEDMCEVLNFSIEITYKRI